VKISTNRLWLRPINEGDNEKLREWRNRHLDAFFSDPVYISQKKQEAWFESYKDRPTGTDLMFIPTLHTGQEIGTIALYDINMSDRSALMGRILLLEKFRGKGYAQEMVGALVNFAFETMRLHTLAVETDLTNNDAISIYHKTGFSIIGMRFIQISKTNMMRTIVIMEQTNPDHDLKKPLRIVDLEG
jgi:RimJ/RimL family protein N-acetyltransferase